MYINIYAGVCLYRSVLTLKHIAIAHIMICPNIKLFTCKCNVAFVIHWCAYQLIPAKVYCTKLMVTMYVVIGLNEAS